MLAASLVAASMDPLASGSYTCAACRAPSSRHVRAVRPTTRVPSSGSSVARLQRLGHRLRQAQGWATTTWELLGRGGMGEVARPASPAENQRGHRLVRPELLGASGTVKAEDMLIRFEREAQATATLSSRTRFAYSISAATDRTFYYVMEMLAGRDLASLVREFGPVPADRTLFLLRQVCQSLAEAHARGLVHRDITPANIYVCRMGLEYDFVKVLDFGLVTSSDRSMEHTLMTGAHTTTGTPAFMAPEIILEGDVDGGPMSTPRVRGAATTGQLVFQADTSMRCSSITCRHRSRRLSGRTAHPARVDQFVLACLEKDPPSGRRTPPKCSALAVATPPKPGTPTRQGLVGNPSLELTGRRGLPWHQTEAWPGSVTRRPVCLAPDRGRTGVQPPASRRLPLRHTLRGSGRLAALGNNATPSRKDKPMTGRPTLTQPDHKSWLDRGLSLFTDVEPGRA